MGHRVLRVRVEDPPRPGCVRAAAAVSGGPALALLPVLSPPAAEETDRAGARRRGLVLCGTSSMLFACALLALLGLATSCSFIVPRSEWRALPSECSSRLGHPVRYVVISHTAGSFCNSPDSCEQQARNVQHYHKNELGWCDVAYNFLIGEDGHVYEGRGWNIKGDHTGPIWNPMSIGITFMGNFMDRVPAKRALRAALNLLECGVSRGFLRSNYEVKGHRDVQSTLSPGDQLYQVIQSWEHYRE